MDDALCTLMHSTLYLHKHYFLLFLIKFKTANPGKKYKRKSILSQFILARNCEPCNSTQFRAILDDSGQFGHNSAQRNSNWKPLFSFLIVFYSI